MTNKSLKKHGLLFCGPTLIAFTLVFVIPFVMGVYLSFARFTTVSDAQFVGLENYRQILNGSSFLYSLSFTALFAFCSVISINVLGFLLALLLTRKIRGRNFFRTVFFMPNLIGGIVLGYIWQLIINGVLLSKSVSITSDASYGFIGLLVLMNWQMIGYVMIIYIAAIGNIPPELIEAARVDGADSFTILKKITIPACMPSLSICLFLTLTNSFKLFDQNLALTAGAPSGKTQMLALDIYNTFYGSVGNEGVGQAKAVIFFIVVAALALLQLHFTSKKEYEA